MREYECEKKRSGKSFLSNNLIYNEHLVRPRMQARWYRHGRSGWSHKHDDGKLRHLANKRIGKFYIKIFQSECCSSTCHLPSVATTRINNEDGIYFCKYMHKDGPKSE
ncbi:hypothetical protein WUBG_00152 [Wuchereria bancrofti]|uniref:Uncharacterized protein n=1 Tax=Wuchereria bancrofti TaxID=6293 RepID=J9BMX5_WUCBA|nr:hypothetical protein WUBG_00152 [Wuchereria bancrofti]